MKIFENAVEILKELSGMEDIRTDDKLKDDLALDSLSMVTLLLEIEDCFGIQLEEADMDPNDLASVEDVLELIEKYRSEENE